MAQIFYNFDSIQSWPVFEEILNTIIALVDRCRTKSHLMNFGPKSLLQFQKSLVQILLNVSLAIKEFLTKQKFEQWNSSDSVHRLLSGGSLDLQTDPEAVFDVDLDQSACDRRSTILARQSKQDERKEILKICFKMLEDKKELRKVVSYLISSRFFQHNAYQIAQWVFDNHELLGLEEVGEFLGGTAPKDQAPFESDVRLWYFRILDFPILELDQSLRFVLTEGGFRMPLESQKIQRILADFAIVYFEQIGDNELFGDSDVVEVLANAILMLNTSLHNPNLKDKDRMKEEQFISICKAIPLCGYNKTTLSQIYSRIKSNPYEIQFVVAGPETSSLDKDGEEQIKIFKAALNRTHRKALVQVI